MKSKSSFYSLGFSKVTAAPADPFYARPGEARSDPPCAHQYMTLKKCADGRALNLSDDAQQRLERYTQRLANAKNRSEVVREALALMELLMHEETPIDERDFDPVRERVRVPNTLLS